MALAAEAGVGVLAVTDHDSLAGVPEALAAGRDLGVRVIPGVELSVEVPSGSMHLLGYFREAAPQPLSGRLEAMRAAREDRARRIVARLAEIGAPVSFADVAARAAGALGRPHLADALVAAGHARDRQDAFDRYLGDDGPAHVPHEGLGPREAIALVRDSGGAAVLAHPATLVMTQKELGSFVQRLRSWGLAGLEVHRPEHTPERRRAYAELAHRYRLVACGGSDFHRPDDVLRPGDTGDPPLPVDAIDRLLPTPAERHPVP